MWIFMNIQMGNVNIHGHSHEGIQPNQSIFPVFIDLQVSWAFHPLLALVAKTMYFQRVFHGFPMGGPGRLGGPETS